VLLKQAIEAIDLSLLY